MSNKDVVIAATHELFEQRDATAIDRYYGTPFVQHSPGLPDGLDALRTAPSHLGPEFAYLPTLIVQDGDYVVAISRTSGLSADGDVALVDIYRLEAGRIVEHWDVRQPYVKDDETVSGNPML